MWSCYHSPIALVTSFISYYHSSRNADSCLSVSLIRLLQLNEFCASSYLLVRQMNVQNALNGPFLYTAHVKPWCYSRIFELHNRQWQILSWCKLVCRFIKVNGTTMNSNSWKSGSEILKEHLCGHCMYHGVGSRRWRFLLLSSDFHSSNAAQVDSGH